MTARALLLALFIAVGVGGCATPVQVASTATSTSAAVAGDPLPSWNAGPIKQRLVAFVSAAGDKGSAGYVPAEERIAVFDNDGTLWTEQPMYFQILFAFDRVRAMAPAHPEWRTQQPFKAVLEGDNEALTASGEKGLFAILLATHSGMTTDEFSRIVKDWMATAKHPRTGRLLTDMVFEPMRELLTYMRANGFKTYIVSGGTTDFMRPWTERVYGIPPEQVVGTLLDTRYEVRDGKPVIEILPKLVHNNDKAGKPVGIHQYIGRRPVIAFGNSDGDLEMLQWTTAGTAPRLGVLIHHTDGEREFAYDRRSAVGHLDKAWDEAVRSGWAIVDMKRDWKLIYPVENR
jgi:phosphoserine phosphatase